MRSKVAATYTICSYISEGGQVTWQLYNRITDKALPIVFATEVNAQATLDAMTRRENKRSMRIPKDY